MTGAWNPWIVSNRQQLHVCRNNSSLLLCLDRFSFLATITSNGSPYATGPLSCLSCLSVQSDCSVGILWPIGWMNQHATWCGCRPQPRRHCVRWEPSSPKERGTAVPPLSAHVYCCQTTELLPTFSEAVNWVSSVGWVITTRDNRCGWDSLQWSSIGLIWGWSAEIVLHPLNESGDWLANSRHGCATMTVP